MFRELSASIKTYSQTFLKSFTQEMDTKLPRELRDMCYEHLMDRVSNHNFTVQLQHKDMPKKISVQKLTVFPRIYHQSKKPFYYEDSKFVGMNFARELVEMYYRKTTFYIHNRAFALLKTWHRQDPFGYDLVVVRNLCNLELSIGDDDLRGHNFNDKFTAFLSNADIKEIVGGLAPLSVLKRRCNVKIPLWVRPQAFGLRQFHKIATALVPIVSMLQGNGCKVQVEVKRRQPDHRIQFDSWVVEDGFSRAGTSNHTLSNAAQVSLSQLCRISTFSSDIG
jgi:hypothetical protein